MLFSWEIMNLRSFKYIVLGNILVMTTISGPLFIRFPKYLLLCSKAGPDSKLGLALKNTIQMNRNLF
jgi:hypothetical protein